MSNSDWIAIAGVVVSLAGLVVALAALAVAWFAIVRGNKNSSAAILITLNDLFRQGWQRFLSETDSNKRQFELAELFNLFEIACAIHSEKALVGVSRELMTEYLNFTLDHLQENKEAMAAFERLTQTDETFRYMRQFVIANRALTSSPARPTVTASA
jgi:hypothetical protein